MGELIAGDRNRVIPVRRRHGAPHVLSEECSDAEHHVGAAGVRTDPRGSSLFLVVAVARGGRLWVTPRSTQQRGVWPNCQCQHDRKYSCSKHVMLAGANGKNDANEHAASRHANKTYFRTFNPLQGQACGISPLGCRKSRTASFRGSSGGRCRIVKSQRVRPVARDEIAYWEPKNAQDDQTAGRGTLPGRVPAPHSFIVGQALSVTVEASQNVGNRLGVPGSFSTLHNVMRRITASAAKRTAVDEDGG